MRSAATRLSRPSVGAFWWRQRQAAAAATWVCIARASAVEPQYAPARNIESSPGSAPLDLMGKVEKPAREADRQEHAVKRAYLEDLAPGQVFTSDARAVVDAASIKRFSGEFDRQVFHLDEAAAQTTFFGEMVASGWHTTAMTMQLIVDTLPLSHGIIGSGVDELRWPRPVRPGDTLHLHCEIIAVTPSKLHPSRGTVRVRMTTLNQKDQPVQTMVANLLAFRRPEQDA